MTHPHRNTSVASNPRAIAAPPQQLWASHQTHNPSPILPPTSRIDTFTFLLHNTVCPLQRNIYTPYDTVCSLHPASDASFPP